MDAPAFLKEIPEELYQLRWRVGSSLGRTVYAQLGDQFSKQDPYLGMMETVELAEYVVALHNRCLDGSR